jgi:ATP-dependent Clp protease ATP-binding subunit ClpB
MTSNLGSHRILESATIYGAGDDEEQTKLKDAVVDEVRRHFRPEFLNRIDGVIVFHALTEAQLKQIVDIQLTRLRERLAERKIALELTDAARTHLVRAGYDPAYGARPLKRVIQKEVETELAKQLLAGKIRDGQTVVVDYNRDDERLTFTPNAAAEPVGAGA